MNTDEFIRRRRQLMRMMGRGSVAILPAAQTRLRNRDVLYPYRQDSDFYYLTGFAEPDAVAVRMDEGLVGVAGSVQAKTTHRWSSRAIRG